MLMNMCKWQREPVKEKGILVGCDQNQEWLLEWWWERYSVENIFPVTFIDFGMTENAKKWCLQHGEIISLTMDFSFVKSKDEIYFDNMKKWEILYGPTLWMTRPNWFKKPFACLHSPYETTVWIDLDCEILKPIDDLFSTCSYESQLAIMRELETQHLPQLHPEVDYNGGVIVFVHGSDIIVKWAEGSILRNGDFWSDDKLLSALIYEHQLRVIELPEVYNWKVTWGVNVNAIIMHFIGSMGKDFIKKHGGIRGCIQGKFLSSFGFF